MRHRLAAGLAALGLIAACATNPATRFRLDLPAGWHIAGFLASIRSFKAITGAEAESIHQNRIDIQVVRPGDTWQSLAVTNGFEASSQPPVGARITIAVGG